MKKAILGVIALLGMGTLNAQDNHYSQFYAAPTYLNPAMAGTKICPRLSLNFRDQWPAIAGTFVSYSAAYDQYIDGFGGFGILLNRDDAGQGTLITTQASLQYSYIQSITRHVSFSFGFEAGIYNKHLNHEDLLFPSQIDAKTGVSINGKELTADITKTTPDFSAGALLYGEQFFVGFAVHHLTQPNHILLGPAGELYRRYTAHVGLNKIIKVNKRRRKDQTVLTPQVIYQKQGPQQELNFGLSAKKNGLSGGVWYRGRDAAIVYAGIETKKFRFGVSYDLTLSRLELNESGGALEISLGYNFNCRSKKGLPNNTCPSF